MKKNDNIQTKEIQAQISSGKTSLPSHSLQHANSRQQKAGGEDAQSSYHVLSGGKALQVACPHLVSCSDASMYETAVNLVR